MSFGLVNPSSPNPLAGPSRETNRFNPISGRAVSAPSANTRSVDNEEKLRQLYNVPSTDPLSDLTAQNIHDRSVVFDVDGTLIGRLTEKEAKYARKIGYKVFKFGLDPNGKKDEYPYFVLRPHAEKVLQYMQEHFKNIPTESSRNFPYHIHKALNAAGLEKYFTHFYNRNDLKTDENFDKKLFPNHSNNIPLWQRFKDWMHRMTFGRLGDFGLWIKSKFDKHEKYFQMSAAGTVNKYPPHLAASHVLVDDKKSNTAYAKRSGDWYHFPIEHFGTGNLKSLKTNKELDPQTGLPKWSLPLIKDLEFMKKHGWQALVKSKYGKVKDTGPVPVKEEYARKIYEATEGRVVLDAVDNHGDKVDVAGGVITRSIATK